MNVSKHILHALVDLCGLLDEQDADGCTLNIAVPDTDIELEVEVSYRFKKNTKSSRGKRKGIKP